VPHILAVVFTVLNLFAEIRELRHEVREM